jgi:hypothetical protein
MEIAGRHHDPFTTMRQFDGPLTASVYSQPVTDVAGSLSRACRVRWPAYNWLVLLSFPPVRRRSVPAGPPSRTVVRRRDIRRDGLRVLAFSTWPTPPIIRTSPDPVAAALPARALALSRPAVCAAIGFLAAATAAVTLSNFYGGLIAAVLTPVAMGTYWLVVCRGTPGAARRLGLTSAILLAMAIAGVVYAGSVVADRAAYGFPRADLFRYSAKWWSYLCRRSSIRCSARWLIASGRRRASAKGLLEQQVSLGWASSRSGSSPSSSGSRP